MKARFGNRTLRAARNERGAVVIVTALAMVALMGFMGLGLDVGSMQHHRRVLQTAADAGALGGGSEIYRGETARIAASARAATAENGHAHGASGVTVTVHHPPISGFHIGDMDAVEVLVTQPSQTYFMRLFGWTTVNNGARAVAWAGANDRNCIYVLEETDPDAFWYNSSARLTADCGLRVNSSGSSGTHTTSNSNVRVDAASLTGGLFEESSSDLHAANGVRTGVYPRSPDPLGYLQPPAVGGCNYVNRVLDAPAVTINPGVYCGKLEVKNNTVVTLNPGVYVIVGGEFMTTSSSRVQGSGVTFFLTDSPSYPMKPLSFQSSSVLDLRAPTTGPYAGILFYQDPDAGDESIIHRWESNSAHTLEGALYFPTQTVRFESSVRISATYTILVARRVIGDSNSIVNINSDYSGLPGGSPLKRLALVE